MVSYGKHLLFTGEILDLEKRVADINAMTKEDCELALSMNFDAEKMAAAVVGRIDKPLSVR